MIRQSSRAYPRLDAPEGDDPTPQLHGKVYYTCTILREFPTIPRNYTRKSQMTRTKLNAQEL